MTWIRKCQNLDLGFTVDSFETVFPLLLQSILQGRPTSISLVIRKIGNIPLHLCQYPQKTFPSPEEI